MRQPGGFRNIRYCVVYETLAQPPTLTVARKRAND